MHPHHGRGDHDPTYASELAWANGMRAELEEARAERDAILERLAQVIAERDELRNAVGNDHYHV